jgi:hypothetical protein
MSTYNRWGAVEAAVLRAFATGGYTPAAADFGGSDAIADELDEAADAVAQAMPLALLDRLQHPELERIVSRAAAGQTVCTLGAGPVVAGTVHIWTGSPTAFASKPVLLLDPWRRSGPLGVVYNPGAQATPSGPVVELAETGFTMSGTDGRTVTLAAPLNRSDLVFASYDVNTTDAAFIVASVADMVAKGAAAMLGAKVFPQATSEWAYVSRLGEEWASYLAELAAGRLVPAELRVRQWWQEPDKTQEGSWGSVRRLRG